LTSSPSQQEPFDTYEKNKWKKKMLSNVKKPEKQSVVSTPTMRTIYMNQELTKCQEWWHMSLITALWGLRQEDCEFEARLDYILRPCLKTESTKKAMEHIKHIKGAI
jgi:hypothetical protein